MCQNERKQEFLQNFNKHTYRKETFRETQAQIGGQYQNGTQAPFILRRHIVCDMLLGGSRQRGYEGVKKYFKTLERLEQFKPKSVHILQQPSKETVDTTQPYHPQERSYEGVKKHFKTLEHLEQFEPNYVHILPTTHKINFRHKVTLPALGAEL